ncbi:MAG: hypothetical protein SOT25_02030 [Malacoplasma sp.]|nr:hypothetical protein [Mycoplasmataceae bacterium]MDY2887539.1 hypothetical protein [Malacoplasma sp.]
MKKKLIFSLIVTFLLALSILLTVALFYDFSNRTSLLTTTLSEESIQKIWGLEWYWWLLIATGAAFVLFLIVSFVFKLFGKLFKIILILGIPALIAMGVSFPFINKDNQKQNLIVHQSSLVLIDQEKNSSNSK